MTYSDIGGEGGSPKVSHDLIWIINKKKHKFSKELSRGRKNTKSTMAEAFSVQRSRRKFFWTKLQKYRPAPMAKKPKSQ